MLLLLGFLAPVGQGAAADLAPRPVLAQVKATSASAKASLALDANASTAWCPDARDTRGELTLSFASPVKVTRLELHPGRWSDTVHGFRPSSVEVRAGAVHVKLEPAADENLPLEPEEVRGQTVTEVVVRLPPAAPGRQRCLSELELGIEEGPWVYGLPAAAVETLPATVRALTEAFRACDVSALQRLVRFPLPTREREVGFAESEFWYAHQPPRFYKSARALARGCNGWVFYADETNPREPKVVAGVGPALVRVEANREGGVVYWHLGWSSGKWLLVSIEFTSFE